MFLQKTLFIVFLLGAGAGWAVKTVVPAGQTLTLAQDLALTGTDTLEINGTATNRCTIAGNGYRIYSNTLGGCITIAFTDCRTLGSASLRALDLTVTGNGRVDIHNCVFDTCGVIRLSTSANAGAFFRNNTFLASGPFQATNSSTTNLSIFIANGNSTATKYFQGNRTEELSLEFSGTNNWVIGGAADSESNILIGLRANFYLYNCTNSLLKGNYTHTGYQNTWSQVAGYASSGDGTGLIQEDNIFRHGEWVLRGVTGELRNNLILDANAHNFIVGPRDVKIHHNIFARYETFDHNLNATIDHIYASSNVEIYNNTFDGGGPSIAWPWSVPVITVGDQAILQSLRSNVFYNHPTDRNTWGWAIVRQGAFETSPATPVTGRLLYADYNCFYNPDMDTIDNYYMAIAGKTERTTDGYARHDLPGAGAIDAQVNPQFQGPLPTSFAYTDADIIARRVTVSQILQSYRSAYRPAAGSPLIDAGDPADGAGNDIGAVETGTVGVQRKVKVEVKGEEMQLEARPNPFKSAVSFELPALRSPTADGLAVSKGKKQEIYIYTASGKCVARLAAHGSPFTATYTWNAADVPAGVYVARLAAGDQMLVKKLLLIR